jgi:hypothetical protein
MLLGAARYNHMNLYMRLSTLAPEACGREQYSHLSLPLESMFRQSKIREVILQIITYLIDDSGIHSMHEHHPNAFNITFEAVCEGVAVV